MCAVVRSRAGPAGAARSRAPSSSHGRLRRSRRPRRKRLCDVPDKPFSKAIPDNIPAVGHTLTGRNSETVNATTAIEMLRYAPSLDMSAKFPATASRA